MFYRSLEVFPFQLHNLETHDETYFNTCISITYLDSNSKVLTASWKLIHVVKYITHIFLALHHFGFSAITRFRVFYLTWRVRALILIQKLAKFATLLHLLVLLNAGNIFRCFPAFRAPHALFTAINKRYFIVDEPGGKANGKSLKRRRN